MQLDIFEHSRDVVLRNAVIESLERRDVAGSARAIAALAGEFADDRLLVPATRLLERLRSPIAAPLSIEAAEDIFQETVGTLTHAAGAVFPRDAQAWLAPFWIELAQAIGHFPFDPGRESLHVAPLLLRAGQWSDAVVRAESIPSWRRLPAPLAWMTEARYRIAGLSETWPFFAELAWMSPARARAQVSRLAQPDLEALVRRFDREFEGEGTPEDFAWFPAWALVADPRLAERLRLTQRGADAPPERAARLVLGLLGLERQGRHAELVEGRRKLRDAHLALFAFYMRSR